MRLFNINFFNSKMRIFMTLLSFLQCISAASSLNVGVMTLLSFLQCISVASSLNVGDFQKEGLPVARFEIFSNVSACHDRSGTKHSLVELSSKSPSLHACLELATKYVDDEQINNRRRCQSACWSKVSLSCHCHVMPVWMPLPNTTVDSAVLEWPCESPRDCSYNGHCQFNSKTKLSTCRCHPGWKGVRCGELKLMPVDKSKWGFRETNGKDRNVSTWGAPILWDENTQQWHGWASEMVNECGINAWNANSQIIHIVSNDSTGPFHKVDVFARPYAHEPSVKRGPNGEWVMLYSAYNDITQIHSASHKGYNSSATNEWKHVVCTNCSQGACLSPVNSSGCPFQRGMPHSLNHPYVQMMAIASTPYGPWTHIEIPSLTTGWDWNTALTIHGDGSAVALIRGGMVWHATDYANPNTWHPVNGKGDDDENKQSAIS